jgi:hypothetical protein
MASRSIPERYVMLGLRLGKHIDGLVDGYFGPPELEAAVEAEELAAPETLVEESRALLDEVDASGENDAQRTRWLSAQLEGLACVADLVAGAEPAWPEAVRRCYGVDVTPAPEERFEAAHELLDQALPGKGDLAARLQSWEETQYVAAEQVLPAFDALAAEFRARTRRLVELPADERIDAETVQDKPWSAYNWYLGNAKSRIQINTDLPVRSYVIPILAAHEGYPGHHTEQACKEARLVRELGRLEASILLIHTPECLVSEGIAQVAIEQVLGDRWPAGAAEILRPLDVPFDMEVVQAVADAQQILDDVHVNVAYLASERGWTEDEAVAYHRRWGLSPEDRARKSAQFDMHPVWSIYVPTYSYGYRLARAFAASRADGFRSLLTEQLTTADLLDPLPVAY